MAAREPADRAAAEDLTQGGEPARHAAPGLHLLIRRGSSPHAYSGCFQTSSFLHFCKLFSEQTPKWVTQESGVCFQASRRFDRWQMNNPCSGKVCCHRRLGPAQTPPARIRRAYQQAGLHSSQTFGGPTLVFIKAPVTTSPGAPQSPQMGVAVISTHLNAPSRCQHSAMGCSVTESGPHRRDSASSWRLSVCPWL